MDWELKLVNLICMLIYLFSSFDSSTELSKDEAKYACYTTLSVPLACCILLFSRQFMIQISYWPISVQSVFSKVF